MKKAILISITIGSIILLFGYYNLMHRDNTNFEGDSTFIYINSSDSIVSILDTINKKIKSPKTFLKAAKRMDYIENIKSGRFNIKPPSPHIAMVFSPLIPTDAPIARAIPGPIAAPTG